LADHIKLEARKLSFWAESLSLSVPQFVQDSADQLGSALSTGDPPGWRPALVDGDPGSVPPKGGRSPISLLSANSSARKSSTCRTDGQYELTEEVANSSGSLHSGTDLGKAPYVGDSAPRERAALEAVLKTSSRMQRDTRDSPANVAANRQQDEPHDSPGANLCKESEEGMSPAHRYRESPRESTNNKLGSRVSTEDEKIVVHPCFQEAAEEDEEAEESEGDEGDEGDEEDEEDEEVQMERTEDEGENNALYPAGADDGGTKGIGIHVAKQRSYSGARSDGGISDIHDYPASEELVHMQGQVYRSGTPAVTVSSGDAAFVPEQEIGCETELDQVTSNDRVEPHARNTKEQREQSNVTAQRGIGTAGAHSNQFRGFYDEQEIMAVNVLQGIEISDRSSADSYTNNTPVTAGQSQDPASTDDGSSDLEEDSDRVDSKENAFIDEPEATPNTVKARARKAPGPHSSALPTPRKRRKVSGDLADQLTSSAVKNIPESLIQPQKISELVMRMLDESHKGATMALANLFFTIGSPYAVECLRDACRQVHNLRGVETFPEEAGARRSTCALDRLHAHDKVSPILRRYHLVQLVQRRDELQKKLNGTARRQEPVVLKYGVRRQLPAKVLIGPKDAAGKALRELMKEAYPEDLLGKREASATYAQRLKELKNRLSAGYNWHTLQARFGIGILALLPVGKEAGIWNSE
jgi:hypothetical protein